LPYVGDVRMLGMVGALELVCDKASKTPFARDKRIGQRIFQEGLKRHLILRPMGDVIYFYLPLCTTQAELSTILDTTYDIVEQFGRSNP